MVCAFVPGAGVHPRDAHPSCRAMVSVHWMNNLVQHELLLGKSWAQTMRVWKRR